MYRRKVNRGDRALSPSFGYADAIDSDLIQLLTANNYPSLYSEIFSAEKLSSLWKSSMYF